MSATRDSPGCGTTSSTVQDSGPSAQTDPVPADPGADERAVHRLTRRRSHVVRHRTRPRIRSVRPLLAVRPLRGTTRKSTSTKQCRTCCCRTSSRRGPASKMPDIVRLVSYHGHPGPQVAQLAGLRLPHRRVLAGGRTREFATPDVAVHERHECNRQERLSPDGPDHRRCDREPSAQDHHGDARPEAAHRTRAAPDASSGEDRWTSP